MDGWNTTLIINFGPKTNLKKHKHNLHTELSGEKMPQNQILLKGDHASNVMKEPADTTMVLMDGTVKGHRLVLASNPFLHRVIFIYFCFYLHFALEILLHQVISSSWVAGEISTILMPQHSIRCGSNVNRSLKNT